MLDLKRRASKDDGVAIVVALAIAAIAFVVVTGILAQSIHNIVLSGYGRRRLAAINAAEGGIDWFSRQLEVSNLAALSSAGLGWEPPLAGCDGAASLTSSCWYVYPRSTYTGRTYVATVPERATFEIRALYTSQNPCQKPDVTPPTAAQCSMKNIPARPSTIGHVGVAQQTGVLRLLDSVSAPFPDTAYVILRSTGIVGGVRRSLETYLRIRAKRGGVTGGLAAISLCLAAGASIWVEGDLVVNNQALGPSLTRPVQYNQSTNCPETYANGDVYVDPGTSMHITPNVSAGSVGSLTVRGGGVVVSANRPFYVGGSLTAEGAIDIGGCTNDCVPLATLCVDPDNDQCIEGDVNGSEISLAKTVFVGGNSAACDPACVPDAPFPELKWNESDWASTGWKVVHMPNSSGVVAAIIGATTKTVFHIDSTVNSSCDVDLSPPTGYSEIALSAQVAVVSSCRFVISKANASLTSAVSGSALLLISAAPDLGADTANCGTDTTKPYGPRDISIENNQTFAAPLFIYTPCILWIKGNTSKLMADKVVGQFAARYLILKNAIRLVQKNIGDVVATIPGQIFKFQLDAKFVREIPVTLVSANGIL